MQLINKLVYHTTTSILLVSYETDNTDYCADYSRCRHRYNLFRNKRLRAGITSHHCCYGSSNYAADNRTPQSAAINIYYWYCLI